LPIIAATASRHTVEDRTAAILAKKPHLKGIAESAGGKLRILVFKNERSVEVHAPGWKAPRIYPMTAFSGTLGPKLREWPSLKRLLEVGVTISGTGRRETNLEPGEYDQGQHDEVRDVLAVNTAGMLVRRRVLEELGGFDDNLPIFGNDIDFGWRAASRGHRTVVVPQAIVFHAEAAHRGTRRTPLTGRHTHYQERRAALFTLLANVPARKLPWQVARLFFGTLVRMVGFFVVRSPGEASQHPRELRSPE
jgi:GT2 family glycosyltransferase